MGVAAAIWIGAGVVQVIESAFYARAGRQVWVFTDSVITIMPWWLSWLVLTPAIAAAVRRFPVVGSRTWPSMAGLVVSGVVISCIQLLAVAIVYWYTIGERIGPATSVENEIHRFFARFFLNSMTTWGAATGVFVALAFARALRDREVERVRLEARTAALETSVARAQLDALRMELNPHFLFNTLNAVSGLVGQDRKRDAREVIGRLGELLRRTLHRGQEPFISLAEELALLEDFLYIERVRFSDRLTVELCVDDAARACLIPSMLLQPLVENAIRHGVERESQRGTVRLEVRHVPPRLRITISDTGRGFAHPVSNGIGLSNTRSRLAHLYGALAELTLVNRVEGGAQVSIDLPLDPHSSHHRLLAG